MIPKALIPIENKIETLINEAYEIMKVEIAKLADKNNWDVENLYVLHVYNRNTKEEVPDKEAEEMENLVFGFRDVFNVDMCDFVYRNGEWLGL